MQEQVFTNYRLQLPTQEILGTLVVRDGAIADIQPGTVTQGENGQGDYLMPGLVELHTDNLEQCLSPRPGIRWSLEAAATYHDRELASAGITTVCDAIAIGDVTPTSVRLTQYGPMINTIYERQKTGKFSIDHLLHLRCELAYDGVAELTEQYADHPLLVLISLMDHTPGQRQFVKLEKYKEYYMGKHGVGADEMEAFIQDRLEAQRRYAELNRQRLIAMAQDRGISLASHDDATVEHIEEAIQAGSKIAEFPTTLEAAKAAVSQSLQVLMGAPNLVLGGSHSGNISAMTLVEQDMVDILSSDYVPHSLLHAAFLIAQKTHRPLYETMRLVTINPARAIGRAGDRGSLEIGKRADLITVHDDGTVPRITSVIRAGNRIA